MAVFSLIKRRLWTTLIKLTPNLRGRKRQRQQRTSRKSQLFEVSGVPCNGSVRRRTRSARVRCHDHPSLVPSNLRFNARSFWTTSHGRKTDSDRYARDPRSYQETECHSALVPSRSEPQRRNHQGNGHEQFNEEVLSPGKMGQKQIAPSAWTDSVFFIGGRILQRSTLGRLTSFSPVALQDLRQILSARFLDHLNFVVCFRRFFQSLSSTHRASPAACFQCNLVSIRSVCVEVVRSPRSRRVLAAELALAPFLLEGCTLAVTFAAADHPAN